MKIGGLAAASGTTVESIRFYEREGLIPAPARSDSNYRVYGDAHVQRLVFVRRCRSLDMALDEIRVLLGFKDEPGANCADVNTVLDAHIDHVASRVQELQVLQQQLLSLRAQCQSNTSGADCGILKQLSRAAADRPAPVKAVATAHGHGAAVHGLPARR